nr:hypothetical protein [Tanacetum cinerariifolium]
MPKSIHLDHHDTAHYILMYHRTRGFTGHESEVYKSLVSHLFHEGRVIEPTNLDDQPNLCPTFTTIGFECLLNINEKICPIFMLQFYKSVYLIRKLNETFAFIINNFEMTLILEEFAQILRVPSQGVYHVMIPLSEKRDYHLKDNGKRPRILTLTPLNTESSDSPSPTPHQNVKNDLVNNYTLDPISYMNQLPPIEGGVSPEFNQTKRMFKCLFNCLCKKK